MAVAPHLVLSAIVRLTTHACGPSTQNTFHAAALSHSFPYAPPQAAGAAVAGAAKTYKLKTIDIDVSGLEGDNAAGPHCLTSLVAAALTGLYEGNVRYRSKPEPKAQLNTLQLLVAPHGQAAAVEAAARGVALAQGTLMARWAGA